MEKSVCSICGKNHKFELPPELLDRIQEGNCVIFAGAGISTENPSHCGTTFYQQICHELDCKVDDYDFPSLMSKYCEQPDGRIRLVRKILYRINYFRNFRGFYIPMTRFHEALRPLYMITDVVTTNWDDFFEKESGFQPFVYEADYAFIDSYPRRLLKLHGSITNAGSLIATKTDYIRALKRLKTGLLGSHLKMMLANKTFVYVGYSLRDTNYLHILKSMNSIMGDFSRTAYFVSPHIDKDYLFSISNNITPIETDGTHFLEEIRSQLGGRLCENHAIVEEKNFDHCEQLLFEVNEYHSYTADKFLETKKSVLILALSYQDGLQDSMMRIKDTRKHGQHYNSSHVLSLIQGYENKTQNYIDDDDYWNACYCRGYQNGLIALLDGEAVPPIVDVIFDDKADTLPKLLRLPKKRIPEKVIGQLSRLAEKTGNLIPEHMPYV